MSTGQIIFVGDLQERLSILDVVLARPEHKVFIGDLVDSWEGSAAQHLYAVDRVLDAVERGEAEYVLGNHEMSYRHRALRCSGFNEETKIGMLARWERIDRLAKFFLWWPAQRVLATHAGITADWWEKQSLSVDGLAEQLERGVREDPREGIGGWFYAIGRSRSGGHLWGGPLWCDWIDEFKPVPGLTQIVGHTARLGTPRGFVEHTVDKHLRASDNGDFNIDCLSRSPMVLRWDMKKGTMKGLRLREAG